MKARIRCAALAVGSLMLVAACSSDTPDTGGAPPSSASTPTPSGGSTPATSGSTGTTTPDTTSDTATGATTATEPPATDSSTADTTAPAESGGKSFSTNIAEPTSLDPAMSSEVEGAQVVRLLFQPLVTLDQNLELQPGVATEWSVGDDGVTWTFTLNPDATFSDGTPVTAADFAFAFARAADPDLASPSAYQGLPIAGWADVNAGEASGEVGDVEIPGVSAVDEHTLQVVTEAPFGLLPKVLTYLIFAPVPRAAIAGDLAAAFNEEPIGNGPYKMAGPWDHNAGITVVRNDTFAGTPGIADEIDFVIYSDFETAYKDFEANNLDIVRGVPAPEIEAARDEYGDRFLATQTAALYYIGMPTALAPFDNVDIRTALSLAIDREAIAERVFQGAQSPATGFVPSLVPGAVDGVCDACVYDPERAKELFDAAGGIPGNTVVFYDISDDGQDSIEPIINSWRDVLGIEVEVRSFEFAQFLDETADDKAEGPFELGWVWDYPSGYSMLSPLYETTSDANAFGYSNPEFDDLMEQARLAPDEESGLQFLTAGQEIVERDLPVLPVLFGNDLGVYSDRLTGVFVDAGALWRLELVDIA